MPDIVTPVVRSKMMASIRGVDTKPEKIIRSGLHGKGFRYKLNDRSLPGKPDLVFPKHQAVLFVHGCFWHRHNCHLFKWPASREEFWRKKLNGNVSRDHKNKVLLEDAGWRVGVVWECSLKGKHRLLLDDVLEQSSQWLMSGDSFLEVCGQ